MDGFTPLPNWVQDAWERGDLTDEAERLHRVLWRRVQSRSEHPKLQITLERLNIVLRYQNADSLQRLLERERERGRLAYCPIGSPRRGYVYHFTLFRDGPRELSASSRPNQDPQVAQGERSDTALRQRLRADSEAASRPSSVSSSESQSAKAASESTKNDAGNPFVEPREVALAGDPVGDLQMDPDTAVIEEELTQAVCEGTKRHRSEPSGNDESGTILSHEQMHALGTFRLEEIARLHEMGEL